MSISDSSGACVRRRRVRRGFTLIELLLVLSILVILGALATVSITTIQRNANIRAAKVQIDGFSSALKAYHVDIGKYPPDLQALRTRPDGLKNPNKWAGPYFDKEIPNDPWGNEYKYSADTEGYVITSMGLDETDGTADDISSES